jgi:hypothetical protein
MAGMADGGRRRTAWEKLTVPRLGNERKRKKKNRKERERVKPV